ncbi:PucR family transcriptional regulator [Paenibacillus sp. 481]|uniref:PucR family transcriptional regulator n=1 Tax=Paenibacillus sp. 481 TaxID=2835869 RepID=UPI001E3EC93B|nr:helix-turn-helix domain-containing protein [Paenibacillus sp. 481]UHA75230.1 helix-turn-helix domain-containing protein [Paenibacillus sp. 481]
MNLDFVTEKLKQISGVEISVQHLSIKQWRKLQEKAQPYTDGELVVGVRINDLIYYKWNEEEDMITFLLASEATLSASELQLMDWLIRVERPLKNTSLRAADEVKVQATQLSSWIHEQLELRQLGSEVPDTLQLKKRLCAEFVPFLLISDHGRDTDYAELYKLLRSYFGGEYVLIPLEEKEWLILCPHSLIWSSEQDEETDEMESIEDTLTSFCLGLYELLASEWIGDSQLSVGYTTIPNKGLPGVVSQLRETIYLGRTFHVADNIHLPWELHLERLVFSIPEQVRKQFLERVVTKGRSFVDEETMATVVTFFQHNCSVSETAKRLYIHRNTLLYRLDKLKQDTGLDVRSFSDAVLVKLILLLYKVTN